MLIIILTIIIISGHFLINSSLLNKEQKQLINKIIFPYKIISQQGQYITQRDKLLVDFNLPNYELLKKQEGSEIILKSNIEKLSDNKTLKKYKLTSGFYAGIHLIMPGSGYIDFYENNMFILSARGVLAFTKNLENDNENFKQIGNNINEFIGLKQFKKFKDISLKDILIFNNKIYVSYTEEIKQDCWNISVIYGDINYERISFKKLFEPKNCIHSINNLDKEFTASQTGGRMISFDDNQILLTTGEFRSRYHAQDEQSINGKVIKININTKEYEIISMGHRNQQGLYFDKENNFILASEHGPQGGDEINLIEVNKINENKIQNFGWPIASAGEHYGGKNAERNKNKYQKYPLYKSHSKYGFIEPLKSFVPSIGISEIVKVGLNRYVVSSLRDKSLYFFELNEKKQIINLNRVEVFERVRDLKFNNNKLYLFMENTASIGVIDLN